MTASPTPPHPRPITLGRLNRVCAECDRTFDLMDSTEADEWFYGHDCEG